ncbi:fec operon regulator FecR [compost metagenome]
MEESIYSLFKKYLDGKASPKELKFLHEYFSTENDLELESLIKKHFNGEVSYMDLSEKKLADNIVEGRWKNIDALTSPTEKKKISWSRWTTVAALLIGLLLCAMYFLTRPQQETDKLISNYGSDVMPGSSRATLILADGNKIELNNSSDGIQVNDKNIVYNNGEVIAEKDANTTAVLQVPNGGIYRLTLADGTKVVLNSGSSLSYPLNFSDSNRTVTLEGEGYFEVTSDRTKPFKVRTEKQTLTVLGTHFNVQSYRNEPIETTLLEGKVALTINGTDSKTILAPNQQATLVDKRFKLKMVNTNDAIAWANNLFVFNNIPLNQIFRNIERWYNVEISYPTALGNEHYLMEIPKDRKLSEILSAISDLTNMKFKIEGRRVTVTAE